MLTRTKFDKELFKRSVLYNVKTLYRKTLEEATPQQIFQAVCYAVKDQIVDDWMDTQKAYEEKDAKTVYYLSMEFLMGRALGNNLINLQAYEEVKKRIYRLLEEIPPDAVTEKYVASSLRDYTQALLNIEKLMKGDKTWEP